MSGFTSMGGGDWRLPASTVALLARWTGTSRPDVRPVVEAISARHWKAVYVYFRSDRGRSNEEAKDLTQAFFVWLMEGEALSKFAPERGSFRHFFKMLLSNFLSNQDRGDRALKRGGGAKLVAFEAAAELPAPESPDPERSFDGAWFEEISRAAARRVCERLTGDNRGHQWAVYEAVDLKPPEARPSYADLAGTLGLSESDVRNHLHAVRKAVRGEIRAELERLTAGDKELEEEWNAFLGA